MRLRDDERAQSVQIGAVLLFAVLVIAFSGYQAFVVPQQNQEVEFNHNQRVHDQMQDLRNGIVSVDGPTASRSVSIALGTTYPSRAVAVNPGPASGTLRTVGTTNDSVALAIENASAPGETGDVWNGSERSYTTGGIVYSPQYNRYTNAPETVYEHSVLYNEFRGGTIVLANQTLIDGDRLSLVVLNGSMDRGSAGTTTVDVRAVSASDRTVRLSDDGGPITISFASRLPVSRWQTLLGGQPNVVDVRTGSATVPDGFTAVTVELATGVDYRLSLTKVGVGTRVTDESAAYLTNVTGSQTVTKGETAELVVEARDAYNNPVPDVLVNGSAAEGTLTPTTTRTGDRGQVRFTLNTTGVDPGTYTVRASLDTLGPGFDASTARNVSVPVTVVSIGGSYALTWNETRIASQPGVACTDENCTMNVNATSTADLTVSTSPALDGVSVGYGINSAAPATIDPGSGETLDGENTTVLTEREAGDGDTATVYATSGGGNDELQVLFETGPFFDVEIDDYDRVVAPGDTLRVSGTVNNTGSEGDTQFVNFSFDGTREGSNQYTLASGNNDTFTFRYDTSGTDEEDYQIEVVSNDSRDREERTVTVDTVPYFAVTDFSAPSTAFEGETITVNATIENTGTGTGTQTIEYRFDGTTRDSETVTLDPDQSTTVQYQYTIQEPAGTYTHGYYSENDSDTATITVEQVPLENLFVYKDSGQSDLRTVTLVGTVDTYGVAAPGALGAKRADLTGGSGADIPYNDSNNNGYLKAVEDDTSTATLDATEFKQAPMGVGDRDGDGIVEVVYVKNSKLYEVEPEGSPNKITYTVDSNPPDANGCNKNDPSCDIPASAVAGIGNLDEDGTVDIAYVDQNGDLNYFDGDRVREIAGGIPSSTGVSRPADFSGNGTVRVAVQDGNGGLNLYDANGNILDVGSTPSGTVAQSPMGAADWNDDGTLDVIYLDQNNGELRYWDPATGDTGYVTDQDGNVITAATGTGAR